MQGAASNMKFWEDNFYAPVLHSIVQREGMLYIYIA